MMKNGSLSHVVSEINEVDIDSIIYQLSRAMRHTNSLVAKMTGSGGVIRQPY